jgi:hypothetical protein
MKISASERMYETSLGVSDDMHELFTAVHEPPVVADRDIITAEIDVSHPRSCRPEWLRVRLSARNNTWATRRKFAPVE